MSKRVWLITGSVYGRQMYELMRYWDDDHPEPAWRPVSGASLRRQYAPDDTLPGTGHEKWPMPNARGHEHRTAHA